MPPPPIALVPFAPASELRHLESLLNAIGQPHVRLSPTDWLRHGGRVRAPNPLLLFIADQQYPAEQIRTVLDGIGRGAIAVFQATTSCLDPGIAAACDEFQCWPCAAEELALRIDRVRRDVIAPPPRDDTSILDEFADLNLIGKSPTFIAALRLMKRFSRCDAPVVIDGETGTGKELAARAIHYLSERRDQPFIPVNCGAIPDALFENELFGHERGAYTDAREAQPGMVALAHNGTLFLDEIDSLSHKAQVVLLRFLQDQHYRPLGSKVERQANLRVIAATNADLESMADQRQFRRDLMFRITVLRLSLPPLRHRGDDIACLAEHFMQRYRIAYGEPTKMLHHSAIKALGRRAWPGNVRELENVIHQAFLMADRTLVEVASDEPAGECRRVQPDRRAGSLLGQPLGTAKSSMIADFERRYLEELFAATGGNVSEAARRAGKERRAFGKLLKKYGIQKPSPTTDDT